MGSTPSALRRWRRPRIIAGSVSELLDARPERFHMCEPPGEADAANREAARSERCGGAGRPAP